MNRHVFTRRVLGDMFTPPRHLVTQGDGEGSCMVYALINLLISNRGLWKHLSEAGLEWFLDMMQEGDVESCAPWWYNEIRPLFLESCHMDPRGDDELADTNLSLAEFLYHSSFVKEENTGDEGEESEYVFTAFPSELIMFFNVGDDYGHVMCTTDNEEETTFVDSHGEVWRFSELMTDGKIDNRKARVLSRGYGQHLEELRNITFKYDKDAEIPEHLKPHENLFMNLNALPKTVGSNMMQTWLNFKSRSRLEEGDEPIPFNLPD